MAVMTVSGRVEDHGCMLCRGPNPRHTATYVAACPGCFRVVLCIVNGIPLADHCTESEIAVTLAALDEVGAS
jgi:hypothetical protein